MTLHVVYWLPVGKGAWPPDRASADRFPIELESSRRVAGIRRRGVVCFHCRRAM